MKKLLALALTLVMIFACLPATALADEVVALDPEAGTGFENDFADEPEKNHNISNRLMSSLATTDEVSIDDENGIVEVVTEEGIVLSATLPFGTVCLTQDILQQLDLYQALYSDISSAVQFYIQNGIHLDIYNYFTYTDAYVIVSDESIAALIGDASTLSDSDANYILSYLSRNWYSGLPGEIQTINDTRYFVYDGIEDYGVIFYVTFIGGEDVTVRFEVDSENTDPMADIDAIMNSLTIQTAE